MDIDLLSKMVKEIILAEDKVVLPGLGTFVAELMPATFSDKGYTINPPYRRLYFRQRAENDSSLAELYAVANNVDREVAGRILADFLKELKAVLQEKKIVVFPGLGRLRATKENNFFFVPDETLDIYMDGFGLVPISLKTHQETEEEVSEVIEKISAIAGQQPEDSVQRAAEPESVHENEAVTDADGQEPVQENVPDKEAGEPEFLRDSEAVQNDILVTDEVTETDDVPQEVHAADSVTEQEGQSDVLEETSGKKTGGKILAAIAVAAAAAVLLFILYIVLNRIFPGIFDNVLYDKEQLQILDYFGASRK